MAKRRRINLWCGALACYAALFVAVAAAQPPAPAGANAEPERSGGAAAEGQRGTFPAALFDTKQTGRRMAGSEPGPVNVRDAGAPDHGQTIDEAERANDDSRRLAPAFGKPADEPSGDRPVADEPPQPDERAGGDSQVAASENDDDQGDPAATADESGGADRPLGNGEPSELAAEGADDSQAEESLPSAPSTAAESSRLPPLSEEMTSLKERLRRGVALCYRQQMDTRQNTPTDVLHLCMAFGCDSQLRLQGGKPVNGVTCLCWNYPCGGYTLLRRIEEQFAAGIGYGMQGHPGQFLAVLALSRVPSDYPIRVGEETGTIADLVEFEKLQCTAGGDLSLALVGLAYYVGFEDTWQNRLGEQWSVARIVQQELERPAEGLPCGGLHRLFGLSYAIDQRKMAGLPIDGVYARARDYLAEFQQYALSLQNDDGTWNPHFFAYRGTGGSLAEQLRATGHILQWLVLSLPEDQLQDPRMLRSVDFVIGALGQRGFRWRLTSESPENVAAVMHAVHALVLYDQRVFQPYDAQEAADE
jgi:hypothetical protein